MVSESDFINSDVAFIQDTLYVVNGKWKLPILITIYNGIHRFREIQRNIPEITSKVFSNSLKDLEQNFIIERRVFEEIPVLVEYHITNYAMSLRPIMKLMVDWGKIHRSSIKLGAPIKCKASKTL